MHDFIWWKDALIVIGFMTLLSIPVIYEIRKKANAPKPRGATRV